MGLRHVNYVLTPKALDAAKARERPYALTDGGGLHIEVLPSGAKVWRYKYHRDGKREKVTLGPYPAIGIKAARDKHEQLRAQLYAGESPAKAKRRAAAERRAQTSAPATVRDLAAQWVEETLFYRSASYRAQILRWFDAYVYPVIGDAAPADVRPAQVLQILERMRDTPTAADRVRGHLQRAWNFGIRKLWLDTNPAAALRGAVVVPLRTHARHLSEAELAAWWRALDVQGAHATTVIAARLLALTMTRKSELIRAKWPELDLERAQWDIPAARMKMRKPHRVFLSRQAVELLRTLHRFTGAGPAGYLFPSIYRDRVPMGEATLNHFFKRLDFGVPEFSPHGLRGTAATLLREHGFGRDVVELLLAHAERDETVAAYTHAELVPERRRAMQFLADRIDELARTGRDAGSAPSSSLAHGSDC